MRVKNWHYIVIIILLIIIFNQTKEALAATSPATTILLKQRHLPMRNSSVPLGRPLWAN